MQVVNTAKDIVQLSFELRSKGLIIGFAPTMGALHQGHMSLIEQSQASTDVTVASVFVNPSQFNESADFERYPRQAEKDLKMLEKKGCDIVFLPSVHEIYPEADTHIYNLGEVAKKLEGQFRPGHFNGVASVVKRLFELVNPHKAFFGLKDYQQYLVIKSLVKNYNLNVEVVGCTIIRDESGLAMSSRNSLLSSSDKLVASHISKSLRLAEEAAKTLEPHQLEEIGTKYLQEIKELDLEYFEVVDAHTLNKVQSKEDAPLIAMVAARVNGVRLIDNMILE